jgi:UDP-N-acetylmuramate: L-alanyl-gamma-D-glutamyl-meso-diaminopimelate ligase
MRQRLAEYPGARLIAVIEPRSATMKMGVHQASLAASCVNADQVVWMAGGGNGLDIKSVIKDSAIPAVGFNSVDEIVQWLLEHCHAGDHIVLMSNGGFGGIHQRLLAALKARFL